MEAYIALSRREDAPEATILRLEAIELDDKALTLMEQDRIPDAVKIFEAALDKAALAGGDALTNDLASARQVVCSHEPQHAYCR